MKDFCVFDVFHPTIIIKMVAYDIKFQTLLVLCNYLFSESIIFYRQEFHFNIVLCISHSFKGNMKSLHESGGDALDISHYLIIHRIIKLQSLEIKTRPTNSLVSIWWKKRDELINGKIKVVLKLSVHTTKSFFQREMAFLKSGNYIKKFVHTAERFVSTFCLQLLYYLEDVTAKYFENVTFSF